MTNADSGNTLPLPEDREALCALMQALWRERDQQRQQTEAQQRQIEEQQKNLAEQQRRVEEQHSKQKNSAGTQRSCKPKSCACKSSWSATSGGITARVPTGCARQASWRNCCCSSEKNSTGSPS